MTARQKNLLIATLGMVWLVILACALWWYQNRYIRPFELSTQLFSVAELKLPPELAGPGPIRMLHFWDPACPCNVGNQQHLAELVAHNLL